MNIIETKSLGKAWEKIFRKVYSSGNVIQDDKGDIKELLDVFVIIRDIKEDSFVKKYGNKEIIRWMEDNFSKKKPIENWGYSYGQRIYDFLGVNQLEYIVKKLKNNPDSKSATISLMMAPEDKRHVPCLVALDFKIRNGGLVTTSFFRSQDIGKKFYADALVIKKIADKVAKKISWPVKSFVFYIKSAHFYLSDIKQLEKIFNL